ncbi:taste receptor type 2 member 40-like [Dendropsophus ebraccatus]|uniref:taste receptor type 2 member 40-like n=1 Tax=Dendropsophus ebraccatus TaxID=150705 RepID=UPI003831AC77
MISPFIVFILVLHLIALCSGVTLNVAIVNVHIRSWRQHLLAGGCDKIVVAMASANVLLQVLLTCGGTLFFSQLFLVLPHSALSSFFFTFVSFVDLCFWNSSWLSTYYCLKLVNLSQKLLLWIKSRFSSAVTPLILGSAVGSFLINLPSLWTTIEMSVDNIGNTSVSDYRLDMALSSIAVIITLGSGLPFLITLFCILLSVKSLLTHVWKLQKNSSEIRYSRLQGHIRAVRTMILLLFLDLMFCTVVMGVVLQSLNVGPVLGILTWMYMLLYPSFQSMIIITGNPKLLKDVFGKRQNSSE